MQTDSVDKHSDGNSSDEDVKLDNVDGDAAAAQVKWVEDEELDVYGTSSREADSVWLLKLPNELYERLAQHKVDDEQKQVGRLRYWSDGTWQVVFDNDGNQGTSEEATNAPDKERESTATYSLKETPIPPKSSKWAYYEDERRSRWSGRSSERARPRLVNKVAKEFSLLRNLDPHQSTMALKRANLREEQKKRRARMIQQVGLTVAQQNILAGGGLLDGSILRRAADTKNTARPTAPKERVYRILPQHLQDILYEEFNRFKYWKMSTLQQRLQQPASWLRQNLKAIAVREETGPYQNYWRLQDRFIAAQGEAENAGTAPENQEYSDSAMMAVKNEHVDTSPDWTADGGGSTGGTGAGPSSSAAITTASAGASQGLIDSDGDEDSEMDEVET